MTLNGNNAIWLAKRQMRDLWIAYPMTAVYFAFMGAVLAADTSVTIEFAHIVLMLILVQPALSTRYMTWKQDNDVTRHQEFLRGLPIGFGTIVVARLIALLAAGLINIPLYFIWFWLIGPDWSSIPVFLAWCTFWVGMALIGSGLALVQEFWLTIRRWSSINFAMIVLLLVILIPVLLVTEYRPVARSIELAEQHSWLMAFTGLAIGVLALWTGVVLAVRFFRKREFAT